MKNLGKALCFLIIAAAASVFASCASPPPSVVADNDDGGKYALGSRYYMPVSDWENEAFTAADRTIFPDDVRNDPAYLGEDSTPVAWAGVVQKYRIEEHDDFNVVFFYMKHHYYDWIETFDERPPIKLSPLGEGYFLAGWRFKKDTDLSSFTVVGELNIVYGRPAVVHDDGAVEVGAEYIRAVSPEFYTTEFFPYKRGGFGEFILESDSEADSEAD